MMAASRSMCSLDGLVTLDPRLRQLSERDICAYLAVLSLPREAVAEASPEALVALQQAHLDRIAYEDLDLHCGPGGTPRVAPELNPLSSFERLVIQRRGGYCFIVVDSFAALLTSLGYVVSMHTAGCGEIPLPPEKWGNHVLLLVHFAGPSPCCYVADVGLGDGPSRPFKLEAQRWEEGGFVYILEELEQPGYWRFRHDPKGSFACCEFSLCSSGAGAQEFLAYHQYYYQSIDSFYRKAGVIAIRRGPNQGSAGVIYKLHNLIFTTSHCTPGDSPGSGCTVHRVASRAGWLGILEAKFSLPLGDLLAEERDALWHAACAHQGQRDATAAATAVVASPAADAEAAAKVPAEESDGAAVSTVSTPLQPAAVAAISNRSCDPTSAATQAV